MSKYILNVMKVGYETGQTLSILKSKFNDAVQIDVKTFAFDTEEEHAQVVESLEESSLIGDKRSGTWALFKTDDNASVETDPSSGKTLGLHKE